jgi:hypothetical protein
MKSLFISTLIIFSLYAENNNTQENNSSQEKNITLESNVTVEESNTTIDTNNTKMSKAEKELLKQMKREEKFAKEQTFYQGDDYDLSYAEVNQDALDSVPLIEPDYDFNMDDVYN